MIIKPRLAEFDSEQVSIAEATAFLTCENISVPNNTPYAWSNSVCTLDGILHLGDGHSVSDVALKSVPGIGHWSTADWRLLNTGWSYADAVLISGEIVRQERTAGCLISFDDLIEHRLNVLAKPSRQPLQVIVTASGNIPFDRPVFSWLLVQPDREEKHDIDQGADVLVATTAEGAHKFKQALEQHLGDSKLEHHRQKLTVVVVPTVDVGRIDLAWLFRYLRVSCDVRFLDVSAGGQIVRQCIDTGLLHETRMTLSMHVAGSFDSVGNLRPVLFPRDEQHMSYGAHDSPMLAVRALRMAGEHLMFIRGEWQHRAHA
eukprot:jgi/Hompol1/3275/HPOL_003195-RA